MKKISNITACTLCPRRCGVNRSSSETGYCGESAEMRVAKLMLHMWEEPCLTGSEHSPRRGCGAVFFSGCSLRCSYCQNMKISRGGTGEIYTPAALARCLMDFQQSGAAVIDLVTPTHFAHGVAESVRLARESGLCIPVVYNTGGYERPEAIAALADTADVFLTDFKYGSAETGALSAAPDYTEYAAASLREMLRLYPRPIFGEDGVLRRGVIVRHLVLPGLRHDSAAVLREIRAAEEETGGRVLLSLMRQYTPVEEIAESTSPTLSAPTVASAKLHRRVTSFEYEYVADLARTMGFDGYFQGKDSADASYTPEF